MATSKQRPPQEPRGGSGGGRAVSARRAVLDGEPSIGSRLAELRKEHRYSIRALAGRANVSASLISDVERGKVEPSISTLKRVASALGTTLTYFFSDPAQSNGRVVRADERLDLSGTRGAKLKGEVRSGMKASGIRFELASPEQAENIEAIYGVYDIGASMGDEPVTHEGEEWGMVLRGRLKVWVGDEIHFLDAGDSIWFPSTIPHRMENVARESTEYIWIDTPKSF
ncbi:MAG TPA: cupin domain-containing protein [Solirubrobacteraceae bacterium]|jgi:transcriptional regulator with XRE-family HTH domain|nr:cupin domain-containing protein [Solirubrobacteraceae bacterium]